MLRADDIRGKLAAGQAATVAALRELADRIEALPLDEAAEVVARMAPHVETLREPAGRILAAQPTTVADA